MLIDNIHGFKLGRKPKKVKPCRSYRYPLTVLKAFKASCKRFVMPSFESEAKPSQTQKFEFEGQSVAPIELIEKVFDFQCLDKDRFGGRLTVYHQGSGEVVLI